MVPPTTLDYFTPFRDLETPERFGSRVAALRAETRRLGILDTAPVLYRVRAGFTLKQHAPLVGPCHNRFQYLQGWDFPDNPTPDAWLFVIPTLLPDSTGKRVNDQLASLRTTRVRLGLPGNHMMNFGSVGLLAGFLLAHHKATGQRLPWNGLWVRTDTCDSNGRRLSLRWGGGALRCVHWRWYDDALDNLGAFALWVELGS